MQEALSWEHPPSLLSVLGLPLHILTIPYSQAATRSVPLPWAWSFSHMTPTHMEMLSVPASPFLMPDFCLPTILHKYRRKWDCPGKMLHPPPTVLSSPAGLSDTLSLLLPWVFGSTLCCSFWGCLSKKPSYTAVHGVMINIINFMGPRITLKTSLQAHL